MVRIKLNLFFILFLFASFYTGYINQSIIIFISVLLHEIGHGIIAKLLGIKVEEIELFPYGGVAKMEDITKYGGYTEALIAVAGPAVSGIIAAIGAILSKQNEVFNTISQFNFILMSFNILPALPLDGGRILRNIMLHYMSYKQATKMMVISGRIIAIALVLYNIVIIYRGNTSAAYIIIGVFIYMGCHKEMKYCSYYYLLHKNNYKKAHSGKRRLRTRIINVHPDTMIRFAANQFSPSTVCKVHLLDASGQVIKVLSEADIMDAFLKYGYDSKVEQIKDGDNYSIKSTIM
jgi:stage IV sporulation protein FB